MNLENRFWQAIHYLVTKKDYILAHVDQEYNEVWLQNFADGKYPFIFLQKINGKKNDMDLEKEFRSVVCSCENILRSVPSSYSKVLYIWFDKGSSSIWENMHFSNNKIDVLLFLENDDAFTGIIPKVLKNWDKPYYEHFSVEKCVEEINNNMQVREREIRNVHRTNRPSVIYMLIAINIVAFLILEFTGGSQNTLNLVGFGAKYGPLIAQGQNWRLFTYMFLHIGIYHLGTNMLSLYFIGPLVENIYGKWRFLAIYVLSGIAGGTLSFALSQNVSAGASGAIFGLMGALLFIRVINREMFRRTLGKGIIVVVLINLIYGFSMAGIDNLGHLGGLFGGFLIAGAIGLPGIRRIGFRYIYLSLFILFLLLSYSSGLYKFGLLF